MKDRTFNYILNGLVIGAFAGATFGVYDVMQTHNLSLDEALLRGSRYIGNFGKPILWEAPRDLLVGIASGGIMGGLIAKLTGRGKDE
jgi:hypothetical protein